MSSFEQTMMDPSPQCYIPSHKVIGPLVLEKKIFMCFSHIWVWQPSWSCDPDPQTNFIPPSHWGSIWNLALVGQAILEKKIFENGGRRTDDHGPWLYYKLPNEPKGSGERKKNFLFFSMINCLFFSGRNSGKFRQEIINFLQEIPILLEILRFCL